MGENGGWAVGVVAEISEVVDYMQLAAHLHCTQMIDAEEHGAMQDTLIKAGNSDAIQQLVCLLTPRPGGLEAFLEAMRMSGHRWLADKLEPELMRRKRRSVRRISIGSISSLNFPNPAPSHSVTMKSIQKTCGRLRQSMRRKRRKPTATAPAPTNDCLDEGVGLSRSMSSLSMASSVFESNNGDSKFNNNDEKRSNLMDMSFFSQMSTTSQMSTMTKSSEVEKSSYAPASAILLNLPDEPDQTQLSLDEVVGNLAKEVGFSPKHIKSIKRLGTRMGVVGRKGKGIKVKFQSLDARDRFVRLHSACPAPMKVVPVDDKPRMKSWIRSTLSLNNF